MPVSIPVILFTVGLGMVFIAYIMQLIHMVQEDQQMHLHTVSVPFLALVTITCTSIFIYGLVLKRRETIVAGLMASVIAPALMLSIMHVHHPIDGNHRIHHDSDSSDEKCKISIEQRQKEKSSQ